MLGVIGALATAGLIGSLKLYGDIQVHMSSPMHEGADKRFDKLENRVTFIENQFKRNDDYTSVMLQVLAIEAGVELPAKP